MKTQNILLLLLLITGNNLISQTISIKGGPLISSMKGRYIVSPNELPQDHWYGHQFVIFNFRDKYVGWEAGIEIDYFQKKRIFLSSSCSALEYGSRGLYRGTNDGHMTSEEIYTKLNSISLNTMINLKLLSGKKIVPYFGLGPQLDFLIRQHLPSKYLFTKYNLESHLRKSLFGFQGVCGINFSSNHIKVGIDFSYSNYFNQLLNHTIKDVYAINHDINLQMNISYFTSKISIGYRF